MDIIALTLFTALVLVTLMYWSEKEAHEYWKEEAEQNWKDRRKWQKLYMEEVMPDSVKVAKAFGKSAEGAARSFGEEAAKAFGKMRDD